MDNSISDKMFTYIATSDFLTQSMINNYNNSFIVIGDEKQAFIPILNSYIGGVGKSSYSYIRSMIIDYNNQNTQTLSLDVDFVNQNKQFNILFTYYNGDSGNYYVYSDHDLTINPNTNIIKYDNFEGNLIGNADTATKLKQSISLWGNSFDGSFNIAGNIIPNENSIQTIGNESKHFSYAYINSVVGHLYGEAETSKFATTGELSDKTKRLLVEDFDTILSLDLMSVIPEESTTSSSGVIAPEFEKMILDKINERNEAKKNKDFAKADQIRDELYQHGIQLVDTREGTTYQLFMK